MTYELLDYGNSGTRGIYMLRKHDPSNSINTRRQILERITKIPCNISATAGFGFETLILCWNPLGLIPRCPTPSISSNKKHWRERKGKSLSWTWSCNWCVSESIQACKAGAEGRVYLLPQPSPSWCLQRGNVKSIMFLVIHPVWVPWGSPGSAVHSAWCVHTVWAQLSCRTLPSTLGRGHRTGVSEGPIQTGFDASCIPTSHTPGR